MSLAVFPFKDEDAAVIARNLWTAARHGRIDEVWGIAAGEGPAADSAREAGRSISVAESIPVRIIPQERIGSYRPGKGDAINTALRMAANQALGGYERAIDYLSETVRDYEKLSHP